jgi:hypothetical protein
MTLISFNVAPRAMTIPSRRRAFIGSILLLLLLGVAPSIAYCQRIIVDGMVLCDAGLGRPGIIVFSDRYPCCAVVTDMNGVFSMSLPSRGIDGGGLVLQYSDGEAIIAERTIWLPELRGIGSDARPTVHAGNLLLALPCGASIPGDTSRASLVASRLAPRDSSSTPIFILRGGGAFAVGIMALGIATFRGVEEPTNDSTTSLGIAGIVGHRSAARGFTAMLLGNPSRNPGFTFAPLRDYVQAPFANPSAITAGAVRQLSVNATVERRGGDGSVDRISQPISDNWFLRASLVAAIDDRIGAGLGFVSSYRHDAYTVLMENGELVASTLPQYGWGIYGSASTSLSDRLAVGATVKAISQRFEAPLSALRTITTYMDGLAEKHDTSFTFSSRGRELVTLDADLSATMRIFPELRAGLSLMNVFGSRLLHDIDERRSERAAGAGLSLDLGRYRLGGDYLLIEHSPPDLKLGAEMQIFRGLTLRAGCATGERSYTIGLMLTYLNFTWTRNRSGWDLMLGGMLNW